jgi:L-threonylcarbamoyladenylate synthase
MLTEPQKQAIETLERSGVVGVPTDTVYGIAARPSCPDAVARLFMLKGRDRSKPIGVLAARLDQLLKWAVFSQLALTIADEFWPGDLTLVLPSKGLPSGVGDAKRQTIGVRIPDHDGLREVLSELGPIAVTSANLSGGADVVDGAGAEAVFGTEVDFYLPGQCHGGTGSTVLDLSGDEPKILRQGNLDIRPYL